MFLCIWENSYIDSNQIFVIQELNRFCMLSSSSSSLAVRTDDSSLAQDEYLEYLREHPSAALPPSPLSPNAYGRPRAPTPSAYPRSSPSFTPLVPLYSSDSPVSSQSDSTSFSHSATHPEFPSESEYPFQPSFQRPSKSSMPLPDPSQFPDPYPFRPPHNHLSNLPALSSAGSSSTRSSAYTSSGRSTMASGDYGHVHVASGDDDAVGVGITSDAVVQLLVNDPSTSPSAVRGTSRAPIDQSRWSESYSASIRSRSSSLGNNLSNNSHDNGPPNLQQKPSYDMGWQPVDEKDEVAMSEEETDDDHHLDDEDEDEQKEEERTSAAVIAEEGRGLIVHGDNVPIVQLHVQPGKSSDMRRFHSIELFQVLPIF